MSDRTSEHTEQPAASSTHFTETHSVETNSAGLIGTRATDLTETRPVDATEMRPADFIETGAAARDALESAFCGSLRSKKFFMRDGLLATDASHYLDASNHCWCRETQLVVGPDGGRAQPARCVSGRSCYSSALEG
jgi:hypothetical protein